MASAPTVPLSRVLTPIEEAIYAALDRASPNFVPRENLYAEVWGGQFQFTRRLDTHVCNLRKKLPQHEKIEGAFNRGYRLILR